MPLFWSTVLARIDRSRIHDRHGSPAFENLAETADFNALIPAGERRLQERLRLQGGPSVEDYLKARDAIEPERRVIVVVGITGAGKSSTANTIRGSRAKEFEVADSLSSVRVGVRSRRRVVRDKLESTPM